MNYKQEYERWLRSDALSPAEHAPPVCGAP